MSGIGMDANGPTADARAMIDSSTVDGGAPTPDATPGIDGAPPAIDAALMFDAAPIPDATPLDDAPPPDASCPGDVLDFTPTNFTSCDIPAAGDPIDIVGAWTLNTNNGTLAQDIGPVPAALSSNIITQTDAPELLIVSTSSLSVASGSTLTIVGSRPVAIVVFGDVTLDGFINASADEATPGPGADHNVACADGAGGDGVPQDDDNGNTGGSGGGGGAFGGGGGQGATVDQPEMGAMPTPGGMANGTANLSPLRGGCKGGDAGNGPRVGGGGGGALQLVVDGALVVSGTGNIAVAGARGRGGGPDNGTGATGGGSGGAILLEAISITIDGVLAANGGGGGEGRRTTLDGENGQNGHTGDGQVATGGNGISQGGPGGNGGANTQAATNGQTGSQITGTAAGGGGGGGSVGRIHFNALSNPTVNGTVSPPDA